MGTEQNVAPKVSIIVPVYNMERYLGKCLDALTKQTLVDIEIVAVNDGSTDSSPSILRAYAAKDSRIRIIDKPNSGYGASMNRGIDEARGQYIGIVEPDDYPDLVMFDKLYKAAKKHNCDLVKCNYYLCYSDHVDVHWNLHGFVYGVPFDPADKPAIVCTAPTVWTGLYSRAFLKKEGIEFRETPGAAFQDTAFSLKCWYAARRVVLLRRPMLHYRMDNPDSSSKTTDKVYTVCDELAEAEKFLRARPERVKTFIGWHNVGKWEKYRWNYERIAPSVHEEFASRMRSEFESSAAAGELDFSLFDETSAHQLRELLDSGASAFAQSYPNGYPAHWEVEQGLVRDGGHDNRVDQIPDGPSPGITVIVPVYNCAAFVGECIASLKRQTYRDFEAIVVDDGSIDDSVACAREAIADDERFTLLPQPENRGLSAVRNIALDRATGEYVVFLDSDDYLVDDALAKLIARARTQQLDDLYFSAQSFYESLSLSDTMNEDFSKRPSFDGVTTGRDLFVYFEDRDQFFVQAALHMVRRQLIEDEGIRFVEGLLHEDILFTFETVVASQRSSFINEPLYMRRLREGSIIGSKWTTRHIHGHFYSMQEIKRWLYKNGESCTSDFLRALGYRMGVWREVCAHHWEHDICEDERQGYLDSLGAHDRIDFFNDVVGSGGAADRVRNEYLESVTYRLGDALLVVPRGIRNRMSALAAARIAQQATNKKMK